MAAVLACGESAVISHRSAAALWRIMPKRRPSDPVEVIARRGDRHRRPGVRVHRFRTLARWDATTLDGIPITTPARTLLDVAAGAGGRELDRAVAEALALRLVRRSRILELVRRHPKRPGASALRALVHDATATTLTRSEAEERLLELVRKAQLPAPETNVNVCGHNVDFYWRTERFVMEVDGFAFHGRSRGRFDRDRRRDAELMARGVRVMRTTWDQIVGEPEALLVRLAQALARSRG